MGRKMGGVVSNGASAPSFDRLVNRIIDCSIGSFVCVCGGVILLRFVQYY